MEGYFKFTEDQILYEDNHLIIINKKPGQIVQADISKVPPLIDDLKEYIKNKYNKPGNVFIGSPHRLDRPTSGIVIFTKTSKALKRMVDLFRNRDIQKYYWAMVNSFPEPDSDELVHYLKKNAKNNKSTTYPKPTEGAKKAILHYKSLEKLDNYSLLEVELKTGRHHQIRTQLAFTGHPIKGDVKYGDRRANKDKSICLHARRIEFVHPVAKNKMLIEAPINSEEGVWQASEIASQKHSK